MYKELTKKDLATLREGEKLVAIETTGWFNEGDTLYVDFVQDGFVSVINHRGNRSGGWLPERFALVTVEEEPKAEKVEFDATVIPAWAVKGQKLRVVDGEIHFNKGDIVEFDHYTVDKNDGEVFVYVRKEGEESEYASGGWYAYHFEPVEEAAEAAEEIFSRVIKEDTKYVRGVEDSPENDVKKGIVYKVESIEMNGESALWVSRVGLCGIYAWRMEAATEAEYLAQQYQNGGVAVMVEEEKPFSRKVTLATKYVRGIEDSVGNGVVKGEVYKVLNIYNDEIGGLMVETDDRGGVFAHRFEAITEEELYLAGLELECQQELQQEAQETVEAYEEEEIEGEEEYEAPRQDPRQMLSDFVWNNMELLNHIPVINNFLGELAVQMDREAKERDERLEAIADKLNSAICDAYNLQG